jgi:hypothetical protein
MLFPLLRNEKKEKSLKPAYPAMSQQQQKQRPDKSAFPVKVFTA